MLDVTIGLLIAIVYLVYVYLTRTHDYWKNKGVTFDKPYPLLGSIAKVIFLQEHSSDYFRRIYFQYPDEPYVGFFQGSTPTLLIRDADLVKRILTTDFSYFTDHSFTFSTNHDPMMAKNLFNMSDQKWKDMRNKLSPTFTSGRMKNMFPLVLKSARVFENYINSLVDSGSLLELKDTFARYTLNVIGSTVFGIECDCINDPNDVFSVTGKKLLEMDLIQAFKVALITFVPGAADKLKLSFFKYPYAQYFRKLVYDVIAARSKVGAAPRGDFLQILLELKEHGTISDDSVDETLPQTASKLNFTEEDILAQAFAFFFAGFETSSSALSFAFYELAFLPEIQKKARDHIEEVLKKHNGEITYQALLDMTYLDCILNETLRKYPALAIFRECTKNYKVPETNLVIEKGTSLLIPNVALHMDPKYFKDPEKFQPERFGSDELIKKNQYLHLPFGEGPRQCIGLRFAKMQSKLALLVVLRKFQVSPTPETKYPVQVDKKYFLATPMVTFVNISRIET